LVRHQRDVKWEEDDISTKTGSLVVVGTGIQIVGQTTLETRSIIQKAEKLLYLVADDATAHWLTSLNASAENLHHLYELGKPRKETYENMVETVLAYVRRGMKVCFAAYGHPGVFANPTHESVRRARAEGYNARMLPGISAEDCLFADLGLDPGPGGCQSFEATDFLVYHRKFDITVPLVLWQIGVIGKPNYFSESVTSGEGLAVLTEALTLHYGADHEVVVYRAALFPGSEPIITNLKIAALSTAQIETMATLYIPPKSVAQRDREMAARLGIALLSEDQYNT